MAIGDRILLRHLDEVAPQIDRDFADADLAVSRDRRRRLQLEGRIAGLPVVYRFVGGGESGGSWEISIQGSPIESLPDLLKASVIKKSRRWIDKRAGQQRVIPTHAVKASAAWVLGDDVSVLLATARRPEAIEKLVALGVADILLSIPPEAQYFGSGRLDAQMPRRWTGRHPAADVSSRLRACVDAMTALSN